MIGSLNARLARMAGAAPHRLALCPPLPGRWGSAGLSVGVAAHVVALSAALAVGQAARLVSTNASVAALVGVPVYVLAGAGLLRRLPGALRQFDRPGPDRPIARFVLAALLGLGLIGLALLVARPYETALTGAQELNLTGSHLPTLLDWAVRGVVLTVLAVPLLVRRAVARGPAYAALCQADHHLRLLAAAHFPHSK